VDSAPKGLGLLEGKTEFSRKGWVSEVCWGRNEKQKKEKSRELDRSRGIKMAAEKGHTVSARIGRTRTNAGQPQEKGLKEKKRKGGGSLA